VRLSAITRCLSLCSSRCLDSFNQAACPLCRTHFDQRAIVRLHVDLESSSSDVSLDPTARQEARRLQMAIANVANEGTTEPRLRQLIADATAFLATQPRELVSSPSS
jgi:pantothenate synthetase